MLTLAIDTSDRRFSVALLRETETLLEFDSLTFPAPISAEKVDGSPDNKFPPGVSVRLFPMLKRLFEEAEILPGDVQLIGITAGPGSFTGLRVGVVTAKTLAYANGIPVVGVNTLEVIARQSTVNAAIIDSKSDLNADQKTDLASSNDNENESPVVIFPVINAQRQQLFCGRYEIAADGELRETESNRIVDRADWLRGVDSVSNDQRVVVTGIGLNPILTEIERLPRFASGHIRIAPESARFANAAATGRLAREKFMAGQTDELWTLEPFYFRPSYAEEP